MNVLVDSSVILASYNNQELNWNRALTDLDRVRKGAKSLWITEFILGEVLNVLSKWNARREINDFVDLYKLQRLILFDPNIAVKRSIRDKTIDLLLNQKKIKASFADLYSVVIIKESFVPDLKLLSYDRHNQYFLDKSQIFV